MDVTGARILINGATGGIGRAIALKLGSQGARLFVTSKRATSLETLLTELNHAGIEAVGDSADLTNAEEVAALATRSNMRPTASSLTCSG